MNKGTKLEALIASEIADFFAGFVEIHTEIGGPNTVEEAQQELIERVTRIASECEDALRAALEQAQRHEALTDAERQAYVGLCNDRDKRIAELEAANVKPLCVKLPPRKTAEYFVDDTFGNSDLAAIYNACRLECEVRIKNAGGTVEGEQ